MTDLEKILNSIGGDVFAGPGKCPRCGSKALKTIKDSDSQWVLYLDECSECKAHFIYLPPVKRAGKYQTGVRA